MQDLFRILPKIIEQFEDSEEIREAIVLATWKKAAGDSLSNHTIPFSLRKKRLTVSVRDLTWKRHLESLAGQMIFKLNSILGHAAVTFIEFQIDEEALEKHFADSGRKRVSHEKLKQMAFDELSPELTNSAGAIMDEELRSQFLLAAGSCLARKKRLSELK